MIASEKRHNTNLLDASFSSYATQERFIIKLNHPQKKKAEDEDELGIFGAEKYFTGAIDEHQLNKTPHYQNSNKHDQPSSPIPKPKPKPKPETQSGIPSVRSESSWNSRRGLLVNNGNDQRKKSGVKSLLASLGCNCNDKASVKVTNNNKVRVNEAAKPPVNSAQKTKSVSSPWAEEDVPKNKCEFNGLNTKRDDCFTFPVLKHPEPPEGDKQVYSERKLTMLNWDNKDNIIDDAGSDASSDLFEIESFSTKENNSFLARQALETSEGRLSNANGYAPSEVSVDWSVVTACAEDLTVCKNAQAKGDRGSGNILSGCHSLKAVRVSGDEYCVTRGAEDPARREWCRGRLDSVTPIAKIQAESKLVGVGCDLKRGQNGFGTPRFVPRTHYLNI